MVDASQYNQELITFILKLTTSWCEWSTIKKKKRSDTKLKAANLCGYLNYTEPNDKTTLTAGTTARNRQDVSFFPPKYNLSSQLVTTGSISEKIFQATWVNRYLTET